MSKKNPLPPPPSPGFFLMNENTLFGPYSRREIDFLRQRGHFQKFKWFWDEKAQEWKPAIDSTPSKLTEKTSVKPARKKAAKIRALVFDKKMAVSGWISQINLDGALFITQDSRSMPPFIQKQKVQTNLILEGSAQSIILDAQLEETKLIEKKWQYKLIWKSIPEELSRLIEVL